MNIHCFDDFLFTEDCALNASSEADMQTSIYLFSVACRNDDLTIRTEMTAPGTKYLSPKLYSLAVNSSLLLKLLFILVATFLSRQQLIEKLPEDLQRQEYLFQPQVEGF